MLVYCSIFYLQGEQFDAKTDSVSETDSDSESENASCAQSPVSGSVHYFIAPLESSKAQDLVVEELNQVGVLCYAVFEATGTQIAMKLKLNLTLAWVWFSTCFFPDFNNWSQEKTLIVNFTLLLVIVTCLCEISNTRTLQLAAC